MTKLQYKHNTKSKFPLKQVFIISKPGTLTDSNQAHMLVYLLATFSEKFSGSHLFTLQWARFKGKITTF